MSLQVNLSSREIYDAYQDVVNAKDIDWAIFTYERGSNDLKVQATGSGGLGELEEEFSDGK
jgi:drebrin-like protein